MDTQQLNVVIKTVADTAGAVATQQALKQTQQAAATLQQQLTPGQEGANAVLRALMARQEQTAEAFAKASATVEQSLRVKPTLTAADLGITGQVAQAAQQQAQASQQQRSALGQASQALRQHAESERQTRDEVHLTANEIVRFAGAAVGVQTGLSAFTTAGHLIREALTGVVQMAIDADQETRNLTATFGSAAGEFQRFAQAMSRGPGGFNTAEIEKGVESTRALAQQFNLTQRQMEGLVEAAGKLATIRDVPLATALNALVQGLQGSSAAASALGLSLSDQQVSLRALGGQYSATFSVLSEGEKTQLRYIELLDQIDRAQIRVSASGKTDAQRAQERAKELENEINRLNTILGQGPLIGIVGALDQVSGAVTQSTDQQRQALRKSEGDYISWTQAVNQSIQRTAEAQGRIAAPFGLEPPQLLGPPPERITDTAGPQALQQVNQALAQARGAAGNLLATTDAQLATLARREAEVTSLTVDFAQKEATAVGQLTAVIRAQIETSGDPAERARLQARLDFINRTADAYDQLLVSQRQLNELQQDSTILAGREAEIRLRALPAMQEMQRVQNQIAQDQVRAQQAAAPSSRAAQDLQTAMQEQRLIAQNVFATAEQRQAAALRFRELALQQPGAELAALRAQRPVTAADRAAEDAARAARLQQLQLEQNLFPITFAEQQLAELRAIAAAVAAAKQQQVDIIIQGAIDISGNAISQISDEQAKDIVDTATAQLEARIHAARLQAERAAPAALTGAGGSRGSLVR